MEVSLDMEGFEIFEKGKKRRPNSRLYKIEDSVRVGTDHVRVTGALLDKITDKNFVNVYFNVDEESALFTFGNEGEYKMYRHRSAARLGGPSLARNMETVVGTKPVVKVLNPSTVMMKRRD